jgi:hypothetical protein
MPNPAITQAMIDALHIDPVTQRDCFGSWWGLITTSGRTIPYVGYFA